MDGGAGEGSEDWEGAEVVPVRGIEEGGEARGDEARPLPVWHPRRRAKATPRARATQAAEAARERAGPSGAEGGEGHGGEGRGRRGGQGSSMEVNEEATVVMGKGKGIKRSLGGRMEQQEGRRRRRALSRAAAVGAEAARRGGGRGGKDSD